MIDSVTILKDIHSVFYDNTFNFFSMSTIIFLIIVTELTFRVNDTSRVKTKTKKEVIDMYMSLHTFVIVVQSAPITNIDLKYLIQNVLLIYCFLLSFDFDARHILSEEIHSVVDSSVGNQTCGK